MNVSLPKWARPFAKPARYKCAYGGRGSSKTWTFATLLAAEGAQKKLLVACCREVQKSIQESAKPALEIAIHRLGLGNFYRIRRWSIEGANGTRFFFHGLREQREQIRGWEGVDRVWVEEAQRLSDETARILIPTIRQAGSEFWFSWNPKFRTDWVWNRFVLHPQPGDITAKVNFNDNPWFSPESERERLYDKEVNPTLYKHIWLGEPDDEGGERQLLPFSMASRCVDAFKQFSIYGHPVDEGLDIANGGLDYNSDVVRAGPTVIHVDRFPSEVVDDLKPTARRAASAAMATGAKRIWYDANGVGAGMGGELSRLDDGMPFARRRILDGESPKGKKSAFSFNVTNGEMFFNRGTQLAWALRMRGQNTLRLMNGVDVPPEVCLFIDPACCDNSDSLTLDEYLNQLSQPVWEEASKGQVRVKKRDDEDPSPDMFDSTKYSFGKDSEYGLRIRMGLPATLSK